MIAGVLFCCNKEKKDHVCIQKLQNSHKNISRTQCYREDQEHTEMKTSSLKISANKDNRLRVKFANSG